ncbi:MAG TPA: acyclic terpene utilization AtuA family protein [Pseudonocardia sp.]|nr:acyclic terpene utilization AtuA family protein [Pseudonocardia sp.]
MTVRALRIGGGAGFAGDRLPPAVDLVERGQLDYLVLECLAERTIALGQQRRLADPELGYDQLLDKRMRLLLGPLVRTGTRLLGNFGAANPLGGARRVQRCAAELGVPVRVAAVLGDDVLAGIDPAAPAWEDGRPLDEHGELVSANAYLGIDALLPALASDADVIVCGRVADPSLFLAPMAHHFGWRPDDHGRLASGTTIGHLLECGPQVTGGYFADPPYKHVPNLARLGYPLAEVCADGTAVVTKLPGTGGRVDRMTVGEQLGYEVIDPTGYRTPDVVADFTTVQFEEVGADRVRIGPTAGRTRPDELKVSVGYRAGFRCEAEISYAGSTAVARARLAGEVVAERLADTGLRLAVSLIGVDALHGPGPGAAGRPYEVRLRVASVGASRELVEAVGEEVTALYTSGPAGGAGVRVHTEEVIGVVSTSIPRAAIRTEVVPVGVT